MTYLKLKKNITSTKYFKVETNITCLTLFIENVLHVLSLQLNKLQYIFIITVTLSLLPIEFEDQTVKLNYSSTRNIF